jgi:hypothetical protein
MRSCAPSRKLANVIWCTGFDAGFDWIDLPVLGPMEPRHQSGMVDAQPGLCFVGLFFLHAMSSAMIHGVGRDALRVAEVIAASTNTGRSASSADRPASASVLRRAS